MSTVRRSRPAPFALLATATLMAACGVTPSTSPSSSPSPEPTPTPIPTPGPPLGATVMADFIEIVGDPQLTMHAVLDGTVDVVAGGEAAHLLIGFVGDISGADGHGEMHIDDGPSDVSFEMLLVDDRAYLNNEGTWTEIPDYEQTTPLNPFANLVSPDDLTYRGVEHRAEGRVHHLVSKIWLGSDLATMTEQGWVDPVIDFNVVDIFVFDDGSPLEMSMNSGASGTHSGFPATAKFEITYLFSAVGEPVEIPDPTP